MCMLIVEVVKGQRWQVACWRKGRKVDDNMAVTKGWWNDLWWGHSGWDKLCWGPEFLSVLIFTDESPQARIIYVSLTSASLSEKWDNLPPMPPRP